MKDLKTYEQEIEVMDQVLGSASESWRIKFRTEAQATAFRHRLHKARSTARQIEDATRDIDDPLRGHCVYDNLRVLGPTVYRVGEGLTEEYIYILRIVKMTSPIDGLISMEAE